MKENDILADAIFTKYGAVKRARGCFLYTSKGVRLTDLYQEGGRAILGWGSENSAAITVMKNILSRGITGSYDTYFSPLSFDKSGKKSQLSKAVSELLNSERSVFVFQSKKKALETALSINPAGTSFYRPWNPENINWSTVPCVILTPPFPWAEPVFILAVKNSTPEEEVKMLSVTDKTECEKIPAPLCGAYTRSIYDLIAVLKKREEKNWFIYDKILTKYWTRKGPYLFPKMSEEKYGEFVMHCLDAEIVISPFYNAPSIVPFGADKGVFKKLENSPFAFEIPETETGKTE